MRRLALVPAAVAIALLAACGGNGEPSGSATPTPSPSATSPGTTGGSTEGATGTATGTSTGGTGGTDRDGGSQPVPTSTADVSKENLPGASRTAVVTDVRAGGHTGYDRVVFEFDGPISGYAARYVDALTQDPSGQPVEIDGNAVLQVVVMGATLNTSFQTGAGETPRTYGGPDRVAADLENVREIVNVGDFEATLSYGIGVDRKAPFRVSLLSSPTRLVVDVAH